MTRDEALLQASVNASATGKVFVAYPLDDRSHLWAIVDYDEFRKIQIGRVIPFNTPRYVLPRGEVTKLS